METKVPLQEISLLDSLGFLGMYLAYITVVLVGRWLHNRNRQDVPYTVQEDEVVTEATTPTRQGGRARNNWDDSGLWSLATLPRFRWFQRARAAPGSVRTQGANPPLPHLTSQPRQGYFSLHSTPYQPTGTKQVWSIKHTTFSRCQLPHHTSTTTGQAPVDVLFRLTNPVVDQEEDNEGWCQYQAVIQVVHLSLFLLSHCCQSYSPRPPWVPPSQCLPVLWHSTQSMGDFR